jgi:hypothetical protein
MLAREKRDRKTINRNVAGGSNVGDPVTPRRSIISGVPSSQAMHHIDVQDDRQDRREQTRKPLACREDHLYQPHESILTSTGTRTESAIRGGELIG